MTAATRIPLLLQTPAAVRFLSCEPLLGPINIGPYLTRDHLFALLPGFKDPLPGVHWVIAGGESGPKARPSHPDWFRSLRDQCAAAGVPYFFKQWGEWMDWRSLGATVCSNVTPQRKSYEGPALGVLRGPEGDLFDGKPKPTYYTDGADATIFVRVGKKAAGRTLDGRTHEEFPA